MNYTTFEESILIALYQEHISFGKEDIISFEYVVIKYGLEFKSGWLIEAQQSLLSDGLISGPRNGQNDQMAVGMISGRGMKLIEDKFGSFEGVGIILEPKVETPSHGGVAEPPSFDVPAADRIVTMGHNSEKVSEVVSETDELLGQLTTGNDVGQFTELEVSAAANELEQLKLAFRSENVRQNTVLSFAKRSLLWIGDHAGGAVVGTAAIALLVLIFSFFGIVIPV